MAYKKTPETEEILKTLEKNAEETDFEKIRCPLCNWSPTASSRWTCASVDAPEYFYGGCYTSWNTFETRGRCPTCAHQWTWTSCLFCQQWSQHEDWYAKKDSSV
jgi:hypothetical protein